MSYNQIFADPPQYLNRFKRNIQINRFKYSLNENLRNKKENPSGHVRDYQPAVIKMEQELSGFKILESHTFYAFEKNYKVKKFLTKVFPNHWKPNNIVVKSQRI